MPLYEYQCDACGHRFELIRKFSDPPLASCPKCGGQVQKLFSSPAFHLKGSGWYATDYARKPGPAKDDKGDKADKPDAAEPAAKAGETAKSSGESTKTESASKSETGSKSDSSGKSEPAPAKSGPAKD